MRRVLLGLLCACGTKSAPNPAITPGDGRPTLVWSVEKNGVVNHFIGTCHLPIPVEDHLPSPEIVEKSRTLYVELDLGTLNPSMIFKKIWDEDLSISSDLGRVPFAKITRQVRGTIPAAMVERSRPWVTASTIEAMQMTVEGADASEPLDSKIIALAKANEVPIVPVETFDEQVELMNGLDINFDDDPEDEIESAETRAQMIALCYRGDTSSVDALLEGDKEENELMLTKRNLAWFPKISEDLSKGGTVVAVGALHMFGKKGLLKQAEHAGYRVTQLRSTASEKPLPKLQVFETSEPVLLDEEEAKQFSQRIATGICADTTMVQPCLESDVAACEERVTKDTLLCLDQIISDKAQLADPAIQNELAGCSLAGLTARAMVQGFPDNPVCDALQQRATPAE